jgi:uncharacterized protein YhfF
LVDYYTRRRRRETRHGSLDVEFDLTSIARRVPGDYWVVLDSINMPKYLVQITDVATTPFNEVLLSFAEREGEGDHSLEYWQKVHREYFQAQCEVWGKDWSESLDTVCEGFELLMSASQADTKLWTEICLVWLYFLSHLLTTHKASTNPADAISW